MEEAAEAGAPRRARLGKLGGGLAVALLAVGPSWGTLQAGWIAEDAAILGRIHRTGALADWTGSQYGLGLVSFWRPVVSTTWALQEAWTGIATPPLRLLNLLSHVGCALLAVGVVRRLGGRLPAALLAGALIGLFPHQGGTVTWIAGRVDTLSGLFLMLAAWAVLGRRPAWAALPAFLACASKEVAFVVPVWVVALLWARGDPPREVVARSLAVVLATVAAFVWRGLALGAWVGGYPAGVPGLGGAFEAAGVVAQASAPLFGLVLAAIVLGRASGGLGVRVAIAGLVCAGVGFLPLLPMLANGVLEPQNGRWLFVGEMGLVLACAAGLLRSPVRAPVAGVLIGLGALVCVWRGVGAWRDTREWTEAARVAEVRIELARRLVSAAEPSALPVLFDAFPTSWAGAYCLGFGAADRFRAPFPSTPRAVWPLRPMFGLPESQREPIVPVRADGSLWPWTDAVRVPLLRVTGPDGAALTVLELDERVFPARDDRSPAVEIHGRFASASIELVAYTELGYEPAPWRPTGEEELRRLSLREALACSNGIATIGQTLLQAADVGATRAFLEIRVVGVSGELHAAARWIELVWEPGLRERALSPD